MPTSSQSPAAAENLRRFGLWVKDALERPSSWDVLRMGIAFEDPEDLSGLIEVVREAEIACSLGLQGAHRQLRLERQGLPGWGSCIGLIVCTEESAYWDGRIRWLQSSRRHLEQQQQRHEAATGRHCGGG
jgi:hypothetical protein